MEQLLRSLADVKASLGRRYTEWSIRAPELEAMIATIAMAQEERGHSAVLRRLLRASGEPAAVFVPEVLDREADSWVELISMAFVFDGAVTALMRAVSEGGSESLGPFTGKILQEEHYHSLFADQWVGRLMSHPVSRSHLETGVEVLLPHAERWLDDMIAMPDVAVHPDRRTRAEGARVAWKDHVHRLGVRIA